MTALCFTAAGRPVRLHVTGGIGAIYALGVQIGPWIQRVPGTGTNDFRLASKWRRDAEAALSQPNQRRA